MEPGTADDRALAALVARLRPDWPPAAGFTYLPGGYSNDNYRFSSGGADYVLRVPRQRRPYVDRREERAFYGLTLDLPGPELVAYDVDSGAMITGWVAGELLADAPPPSPALVPYLQQLHGALRGSTRRYDPVALARRYLARGSADAALRALAVELRWQPPVLAVCHNDLNPWNVIRAPAGHWVTLDWELLGLNDPLFDLVTLHQGFERPTDELPALAAAYGGEGATAGRVRACLTGFWLREYAWAWAEWQQGNRRPEIDAQLDRARTALEGPAAPP